MMRTTYSMVSWQSGMHTLAMTQLGSLNKSKYAAA